MKKNWIYLSVVAVAMLAAACSKDSTPAAVSPTSAQATFSSVNTDVAAAVNGLNTAPGNVALNSFASLNNSVSPFSRLKSFSTISKPSEAKAAMGAAFASIRVMLLHSTATEHATASTAFDFASKIGTYTWSKANHKWNYTSGGSIIKIDYPSDTTSDVNDTELQISAYTETTVGNDYYPTDIEAAVYQPITAGTKELGLSFQASGYDDSGSPNKVSIALFINPYTIAFAVDDSQTLSTTESFSFTKGSTTYIGTSATATYASAADQTNGNPSKVTGYWQLENTRFDVAVDGTKAATATSPGDYITITVTINGGLAGHVIWADPNNTAYILYTDGKTMDKLDDVFASLESQLSSINN